MKDRYVLSLIKDLIDKINITQEQFAQKVGVPFSTIRKGSRSPQPFLFQRLIEIAKEAGLKNIENIKKK